MAGIDIGGGRGAGRRRDTNSDVNMIPFIDLLLVTTAFLLITAVWSTNARLEASAEVPGPLRCDGSSCEGAPDKRLHVTVDASSFRIAWKQAGTVLSEVTIPKQPVAVGDANDAALRFPDLAKRIEDEWSHSGAHRDRTDRRLDEAVVHADDHTPFRELAAVLDAIESPKRDLTLPDGRITKTSAFNPVFAVR